MSDTDAHLSPCLVVDTQRRSPGPGVALTPRVQALLRRWAAADTYWIPGGIDLLLDEHLADDADRRCLRAAIERTIERLKALGPVLPSAMLNEVVGPQTIADYGDRATAKAIQALQRVDHLVQAGAPLSPPGARD